MNEPILDKGAELQGLSTAVLLPSVDLFDGAARRAVDPLTPIAGMSLFQRTVLTLQRAGIRQVMVLAGAEEEQLKQSLLRGPRVTVPVRWMPIREFPLDDARTWEALAAEVRGFCLLSGVGTVFSRSLIEELRRDVRAGQAILVGRPHVGEQTSRACTPAVGGDIADVIVIPASELRTAGELAAHCDMPIGRWLEQASVEGRVRRLATGIDRPACWYQPVLAESDLCEAERRLYSSLKGDFEGFVDRYFNRRLSRWCTRAFVAMGWSPNAITILATVIGLFAAVGFATGSYTWSVIAAVLFQFAAVIDCSDGEVARLTFTESPFGAWLDITLDNVVHMAIFGGIALGAYARTNTDDAWIPLALGAGAVFGNAVSFLLVNKAQKIGSASEWKTPVDAAWSDFMLKNVASRDFSVVVLLFAVFGKLEAFLWLAAIGSLAFAAVMVWVIRPAAVGDRFSR